MNVRSEPRAAARSSEVRSGRGPMGLSGKVFDEVDRTAAHSRSHQKPGRVPSAYAVGTNRVAGMPAARRTGQAW